MQKEIFVYTETCTKVFIAVLVLFPPIHKQRAYPFPSGSIHAQWHAMQ
jgi:hypothetical protein